MMFLFTVNAHSKWPEVFMLSSTTVNKTMDGPAEIVFTEYGYQIRLFMMMDLNSFLMILPHSLKEWNKTSGVYLIIQHRMV